jgi:hypothetical protein
MYNSTSQLDVSWQLRQLTSATCCPAIAAPSADLDHQSPTAPTTPFRFCPDLMSFNFNPKTISFHLLVPDMFEQHNKITQSTAFFEPDTAAHF